MLKDIKLNPFPGLRAFEEEESIIFFGRDKQVKDLLKKLNSVKFVTVIGSPGSGKSSLVKSGLIPALTSDKNTKWKICSFKPGNQPIQNMAISMAQNGLANDHVTLETNIRQSDQALTEACKAANLRSQHKVLFLVDQFEELFRFISHDSETKTKEAEAIAFINSLLKAAQNDLPIYVVLTMRSEMLGNCTTFIGLPEAINEGQYLVPRMSTEEQSQTITEPAKVAGANLSSALVNQLLIDFGDKPDQLPILQHALMRTWDHWKKKNSTSEIGLEAYNNVGAMHALSQHAEEVYAELNNLRSQQICETIFRALTDRGTDGKRIRQSQKLNELCSLVNASSTEVIAVIDVFREKGRGFLMPSADVLLTESSIIEIAHDSILQVWERLILWVDDEHQAAQTYLRLCEAANRYEIGKGGLLRDPELQVAWKWKEEITSNAVWAARYNRLFEKSILFLEHSKEQFEKELVFKEKMQKQRLRRAKRVAIVISIIALCAFLLAIYSFELRNVARKQTTIAQKESVEAKRQRKLAQEQEQLAQKSKESALLSAKQALEQKNIADQQRENATKSEKNALLQKVIAEEQKAYADRQKVIAESNAKIAKQQQGIAETQTQRAVTNEKIAVEQRQISGRLKDLAEARNLAYDAMLLLNDRKFEESKKEIIEAYKLNTANNGPLQNSDIYTALQFNWIDGIQNKNQFPHHKYPIRSIAKGPETNQLLSVDESGMVYLSTVNSGILKPISYYDLKDEVRSISSSTDGSKAIVITATGNAILLSISSSGNIKELARKTFIGIGKQVIFKNNTEFVILSNKGLGIYWADATINETKFIHGTFNAITFAQNGKFYIASGSKISAYAKADDVNGNASATYSLPSRITSIAISPANDILAAGTYEGGIWVKELQSTKAALSFTPHASAINDIKFNSIGKGMLQLASASSDQTVKLIDVDALLNSKNTEDILTLRSHNKWVYCLTYTADGKYLYTGSEDKKIVGWHTTMAGIYQSLTSAKN
ncbi:MAG: hypothetical protein V4663_02075 [Bacteroidota bacterium]